MITFSKQSVSLQGDKNPHSQTGPTEEVRSAHTLFTPTGPTAAQKEGGPAQSNSCCAIQATPELLTKVTQEPDV